MPLALVALANLFLSTPSARRATRGGLCLCRSRRYFYPRPPRGGRLSDEDHCGGVFLISIHALREEGDLWLCPQYFR